MIFFLNGSKLNIAKYHMKVIFLDFDGVLNNMHMIEPGLFCHKNMQNLRLLCEKTDAMFVLSTSHRVYPLSLLQFENECHKYWLTDRTYGYTEYLYDSDNPERPITLRVKEIKKWLSEHSEVDSWVVLDDMDMKIENIVKTDFAYGLTIADVVKAIEILNGEEQTTCSDLHE